MLPDINDRNGSISSESEQSSSTSESRTLAELIGMEKYENLGAVGEGSYGMVLKCRHKETQQVVAIKKFLESDDDKTVKKIAMREVRMLKQLRHENLVNLIEVFRKKKRLYLVFEFVDHTVLDELEQNPHGLDEETVRQIIWQVISGIDFCHAHNIIHRDIKPENILISNSGVVKLCDFGFARTMAQPGETYTDYVATRWYRAPELLVGDTSYGKAVDIWAVGCLAYELITGEPLFPGESDIDQLYHIVKCFGNLTQRHREIFYKNPIFMGMKLPEVRAVVESFDKKCSSFRCSKHIVSMMKESMQLDANNRPSCSELLKHYVFTHDKFSMTFPDELKYRIEKENQHKPLNQIHKKTSPGKRSGEKEKTKKEPVITKDDQTEKRHTGKTDSHKQTEQSSMPVISPHLPLVNGTQSPSRHGAEKHKTKPVGKQKLTHAPLDLGFKSEKTVIHDKYSKQSRKTTVEEEKQVSYTPQSHISLPEVKRTDGTNLNVKTSGKKSSFMNGHYESSRQVDSQLSERFPSV